MGPGWAVLLGWAVSTAVCLLQAVGFASRERHGMAVNRALGVVVAVLALPATAALVGYVRAGSGWWVGPAAFDAFVVLMLVVDYLRPLEFRAPRRPAVLVPYLVLFFGGIALLGAPMSAVDRRLWLVNVAAAVVLLAAMGVAVRRGRA